MQKNLKELFLIEHFIGLFTKNDTTQMKNLSMPKWLTKKQPKYKAVFLWGDLDQDQWSKICLDHGASKELANPLMDSPVLLMHHDSDTWSRSPQRNAP